MVLIADGGGGGPTLNPKAKHYERQLIKVFSTDTHAISQTETGWPEAERDLELNMSTFAAVRAEQAEIMRMLAEIRDLPLPPLE